MKTAGQIDGEVSFIAGQFARCLALNEPPGLGETESIKISQRHFELNFK